jgi:hypothetical protein
MANRDAPKGFEPYGALRLVISQVAGEVVNPGEFVKLDNTGRVVACATGDTIYGLCLDYASAAGERVNVSVHPEQLYVGQADESEIDAQTDVGNMCDIVATADNTTYKTSRMEIDSSTIGAAAAQLMILDIERRPDNAYGEFVDVIVKINEHQAFGKDAFAGI